MRIHSHSFAALSRIPGEFAYAIAGAGTPTARGGNRNPHLAWSDVPEGTRGFALICVDDDVPSVFDDANQPGKVIRADLPRRDFIHWVMVDIPASVRELAAGSCADGIEPGGKRTPPGPQGAQQGVNDYGDGHFGYDGPCPPWNDERLHHYHFRLYALDCVSLGLHGRFSAKDALAAMAGHVLASAQLTGTYSLNPAVR